MLFGLSTSEHARAGRWCAGFLTAGLLAGITAATGWGQGGFVPQGLVEAPQIDGYVVGPASDAAFTYRGWVNFPGSRGHIDIELLRHGNGDAADAADWTSAVVVFPSSTPEPGTSTPIFRWTLSAAPIFQSFDSAWPEGGTARVRFRAVVNNPDGSRSQGFLAVRDRFGIRGPSIQLILADMTPSRTDVLPIPNFLSRGAVGFVADPSKDTERYYKRISIDPLGVGDQKIVGGTNNLDNLGKFVDRYFRSDACPGTPTPEVVTRYYNEGDLGVGREMHCKYNPCSDETACYVRNFGRRDGTPLFNDFRESSVAALITERPFATVAMVERGMMGAVSDKVFFVVYGPDGRFALKARLDNTGYNQAIPGNCLVCHGPGGTGGYTPGGDVRDAYFLPFDLSSFRFYSGNPTNGLSRPQQEQAFKLQNQMVYLTDVYLNQDARHLLEGWYGGVGFPLARFQAGFVPAEWNSDANTRQLYRRVVARVCRTCHIVDASNGSPKLTFGSFAQFSANATLSHLRTCGDYTMPNAEQTQRLFWQSDARAQFLSRLGLTRGCGLPASDPTLSVTTARQMLFDYRSASCACSTSACLREVNNRFESVADAFAVSDPGITSLAGVMSDAVRCHRQVIEAENGTAPFDERLLMEERIKERTRFVHELQLGTRTP